MASRRQYLYGLAQYVGVTISTYSPGDGVTRYRFFSGPEAKFQDYFGPSNGMGTALGLKEAIAWMEGYRAGREQGMKAASQPTD